MPELPEVETMRRGIAHLVGREFVAVRRTPSPRKPIIVRPGIGAIHRRLKGRTLVAVERLGKRVVLRADNGDRLVIEPRMTGLVLIGQPPTREHLRLQIELAASRKESASRRASDPVPSILFWDSRGLGVVTLLSADEYEQKLQRGKIGPDAVEIAADDFCARVGKSRTPVKVALLDQARVAGIGNLYASEMLHVARIDPRLPASRLSRDQWQRLYRAMRDVLNTAIRFEGSTLADGTYRNALNEPGGYQNHHRVYDRAGESCRRCRSRSKIVRIVQAQRSTFWCPGCQKKR
jgi:formamidopyrimidine-DNA glycosylase